jgi:AraC family transcriptional regulator, transcriptional activator of pobA
MILSGILLYICGVLWPETQNQNRKTNVIRVERFRPALRDRVFSLPAIRGARTWRSIFLTSGTGAMRTETGDYALHAPCLFWSQVSPGLALFLKAGSDGWQIALNEQELSSALGNSTEASELRRLSDLRVSVGLQDKNRALADTQAAFLWIEREVASPTIGSNAMIEAQVKALLVLLWRNMGPHELASVKLGRNSRILQQFRQQLESHFRDRWTVKNYATQVGVSADHLHEICTRTLSRSPSSLIKDRTLHEAKLLLANSTLTVQQISERLGFNDVSHFSRYFHKFEGAPPGQYRKVLIERNAEMELPAETAFANWP